MSNQDDFEFKMGNGPLIIIGGAMIIFGIIMGRNIPQEDLVIAMSVWTGITILFLTLFYLFQVKMYLKFENQGFTIRNYKTNQVVLWTEADEYLVEFKPKQRASTDLLDVVVNSIASAVDEEKQIGEFHFSMRKAGKKYKVSFANIKFDRLKQVIEFISKGINSEPQIEKDNPDKIYGTKWIWKLR